MFFFLSLHKQATITLLLSYLSLTKPKRIDDFILASPTLTINAYSNTRNSPYVKNQTVKTV